MQVARLSLGRERGAKCTLRLLRLASEHMCPGEHRYTVADPPCGPDTACQRQALLCLRNGLLRHQHRVVTVCECVVRARHPLLMTSLLRQVQRLAPASQSLIEISKTESDGAGDESSITLRCQRAN